MTAEAFGMGTDGLGEHPKIIVQALRHDVKMTACFLRLLAHFPPEPAHLRLDSNESPIDPLESLVNALKSLINTLESRIYRPFELGNRHRFTKGADHSIVVHAMTMPSA